MKNKVAIDLGARGRVAEIQFEDEAEGTFGVGPITVRFLNRFSGHALGRSAFSDSSWLRKLFWLVVFFIALGYMIYGIIDTLDVYMSGPTMTTTKMEVKESLPFPAVTICPNTPLLKNLSDDPNISPVLQPLLKINEAFERMLKALLLREESWNQPAAGGASLVEDTVYKKDSNGMQETCVKPFAELSRINVPRAKMQLQKLVKSSNYTLEDFREDSRNYWRNYVLDVSNSMRYCTFNRIPCSVGDLKYSPTKTYGSCVTFNPNADKLVQRPATDDFMRNNGYGSRDPEFFKGTKPSEGLQLVLTSYASNSVLLLSGAEGFRLGIHHSNGNSDPFEQGFDVNFQKVSNVGIRMVEFERLHPDAGGDCAMDSYLIERFDPNIFNVPSGTKYSKELCLDMSFSRRVMQVLEDGQDCLLKERYALLLKADGSTSHECNLTRYGKIKDKIIGEVRGGDYCPAKACTQEKFEWSLSTAQMSRETVLLLNLIDWMRKNKDLNESELMNTPFCHHLKENFALVNVYYQSMAVEKVVETLMYPWSNFIGTLGGLIGLYMGFSMISLLEVLEWIMDMLLYGWRKPRNDRMGPKRSVIITWNDTLETDRDIGDGGHSE